MGRGRPGGRERRVRRRHDRGAVRVRARTVALHAERVRPARRPRDLPVHRRLGRWGAAHALRPPQPRVEVARRDLTPRGRGARGDGGPPVLRARRHRPARLRVRRRRGPHRRRAPGRLDAHPAARPQPLPRRDRQRRLHHAEAEGGHHGAQDRTRLHEGRDPGALPQHGPVPLQRVGDRDGRADLLLDLGRRPRPAPGGHARRDAQGDVLVQPVPQPRAREGASQRGPRPARPLRRRARGRGGAAPGRAAGAPVRAPANADEQGAPLHRARPRDAGGLGRRARLQPLRRRPHDPHHARLADAAGGDGDGPALRRRAPVRRRRGVGARLDVAPRDHDGALRHGVAHHAAVRAVLDAPPRRRRRLHPRHARLPGRRRPRAATPRPCSTRSARRRRSSTRSAR